MDKFEYLKMQKQTYEGYLTNENSVRELCVGNWKAHEAYPYEELLLKNFYGTREVALDFGCGPGRMIKRMLKEFLFVDGADFIEEHFEHARNYLSKNDERVDFIKTDGLSAKIPEKYNFIYSTICLQHIACYEIRSQIIQDLSSALYDNGQMVLQMGYGYNTGVGWFDNQYSARYTNGGLDVSITKDNINSVVEDLEKCTNLRVKYELHPSPHPKLKFYHPNWIFFYMDK